MLWHKWSLVINCAEYLFIRKAKRVVSSVKNANKITAAGLEGFPAPGKGRLNDLTDSNTASSFPVLTGPPRPTFPKGFSGWWASSFLGVGVPGEHPELRSSLMHHGRVSPWPCVLRCSSSSIYLSYSPCWISYPWNADLAGRTLSIQCLCCGSEGRCNPEEPWMHLGCRMQGSGLQGFWLWWLMSVRGIWADDLRNQRIRENRNGKDL